MSKNITIIDKEYKEWIKDLSMRYRRSQIKAAVKVNTRSFSSTFHQLGGQLETKTDTSASEIVPQLWDN